jgi:hypothetical protein
MTMNTPTEPVLVQSMTKSLRFHQGITIATTFLLSAVGFGGLLFQNGSTEDREFACFFGWFFLVATCLYLLIMLSYDIFFIVEGQEHCVVRVRRWWGWKWTRVYPAQDFSEVQTYQVNGSPIAGHYLQLVGDKKRLRLVYCPHGKGLEELAERIAVQLQLPYYSETAV